MLLNKEQLCMSLSTLANDDYTLLNDIIVDYVYNKLNNKELDDYEDYVNANLNEIMWGLHHYYRVLRGVAKLTQLCYN